MREWNLYLQGGGGGAVPGDTAAYSIRVSKFCNVLGPNIMFLLKRSFKKRSV